ncbi:MAG: transposase [Acidiferrobacterales bacterium]
MPPNWRVSDETERLRTIGPAYASPIWAGNFPDGECRGVMRLRIEPTMKIARMFRCHRELILNWFRAQGRLSNGVVEGMNNKAKMTLRKSYGFRSPEILKMALLHALGKLPEAGLAHEFY